MYLKGKGSYVKKQKNKDKKQNKTKQNIIAETRDYSELMRTLRI